jgi:hypothetical protein
MPGDEDDQDGRANDNAEQVGRAGGGSNSNGGMAIKPRPSGSGGSWGLPGITEAAHAG